MSPTLYLIFVATSEGTDDDGGRAHKAEDTVTSSGVAVTSSGVEHYEQLHQYALQHLQQVSLFSHSLTHSLS